MNLPEQIDERELLIRLKHGDQEAFRLLYNHYIPRLLDYLKSYTRDTQQADEAVQQIFINIWQLHEKIDPDLSFRGYLLKSLKNYIYNQYRNQIRTLKRKEKFLQETAVKRVDQPDEFLQVKELEALIHHKISHLPPVQKEIFLMSREEGLSNEEIANRLNVSRRTVEHQIYRALKNLKKSMVVQENLFCFLIFLYFH